MKYIRVENNSIVGVPTDLPISAYNISNFYLLPQETLREYGWYPFEIEEVELGENEVISRWEVFVEETKVVRRATKRILTEEEINKSNEEKLQKEWSDVRSKRNLLLSESDWTQLPDAPISSENKGQWIFYRQTLRDITNVPSPNLIVWPHKPDVIKPTEIITDSVITSPYQENTEQQSDPNLGG